MSTVLRRRPLLALVEYTVRTCLPSRLELLLLPSAGALLFGLLSRLNDSPASVAHARVVGLAMHGLVLPITALVVGDAVLGAELRSGTFSFTWLSPVRHSTIVLGRWLGGCVVAAALLLPAAVVGALAAGAPSAAPAAALAIGTGAAAYVALFIAIGATFQRAVVWSLVLVILIERLLGAALHSIAQLTPGWLAQNALTGLVDVPRLRIDGVPYGWSAVGRLAMVAAFGLGVAVLRMPRLRPASAAD